MKKVGILGGGQLGKMLIQSLLNYPVEIHVLDPDPECVCAKVAHSFVEGDFRDEASVETFAKQVDILTIEIEQVSISGLEKAKNMGVKVIPDPQVVLIFQNKQLQKLFYDENKLPTEKFFLSNGKEEIISHSKLEFPFVQKTATGGYDGKGVQIISSVQELNKLWDVPSVIENKTDIKKEVSVIFVKNSTDEVRSFPPVEMVFNPNLNLVDYLFSPAEISSNAQERLTQLIPKIAKAIHGSGIFAVELFLTQNDEWLINEIAPRPHNSGHASIEANHSSQYDQLARLLLGLALPETEMIFPSAMVNLVATSDSDNPDYSFLEKICEIHGVYPHIYGKSKARKGRKMGHFTILGEDKNELIGKVNLVKSILQRSNF